jgi:hypothetical protein
MLRGREWEYCVEGAVVLVRKSTVQLRWSPSLRALAISRRKDVKCLVAGARVKAWFR